MFDLTGKTAVVTGGNRGIGLGYARGLAKAGANVAIWSRNAEKNRAAVDELRSLGVEAVGIECDVTDEVSVTAATHAVIEAFDGIDALFANAGVSNDSSFPDDFSLERWRSVLEVNLDGVFLTCREVSKAMIAKSDGGSIVLTASVAGRLGIPRQPHYSASKGAVLNLTRSLAQSLAKHRIRVNSVSPGFIETEMTDDWTGNERFEQSMIKGRVPLKRWGTVADFEGVAVYLASDASSFMTGADLTLDGGLTTG